MEILNNRLDIYNWVFEKNYNTIILIRIINILTNILSIILHYRLFNFIELWSLTQTMEKQRCGNQSPRRMRTSFLSSSSPRNKIKVFNTEKIIDKILKRFENDESNDIIHPINPTLSTPLRGVRRKKRKSIWRKIFS